MRRAFLAFALLVLVGGCTTDQGDGGFATFDVNGVEVVAAVTGADLPEWATLVEFTALVVDPGSGPGLCLWGAEECLEGVPLEGLSAEWWTAEQGDARWGERRVVVEWDGYPERLTAIEDGPPVPAEELHVDPARAMPEECRDIDEFVSNRLVYAHQRTLDESQYGGVYALNEGGIVLQVTDDPDPHREALAVDGAEACVIRVPYSEDEYRTMAFNLQERIEGIMPGMAGVGSEAVAGRFEVHVPVADRATVARIAAETSHPDALRVVGFGVIVDGS